MTDWSDINNDLLIFKDQGDPRMRKPAGDGRERIFFCTGDCEIGYSSFTVDRINRHMEDFAAMESDLRVQYNAASRSILHRMISLMRALQGGSPYPGPMNDYPYALEEYPRKYEALVCGLSDTALDVIRNLEEGRFCPPGSGEKFCRILLKDRERLLNPLRYASHRTDSVLRFG